MSVGSQKFEGYTTFPSRKIGGNNPYYCCSYCGVSVPVINGNLKNHQENCEYRIREEKKLLEAEKMDLNVLKKVVGEYLEPENGTLVGIGNKNFIASYKVRRDKIVAKIQSASIIGGSISVKTQYTGNVDEAKEIMHHYDKYCEAAEVNKLYKPSPSNHRIVVALELMTSYISFSEETLSQIVKLVEDGVNVKYAIDEVVQK